MSKIARYLNQLTVGNVFDAPEILEAYAVDQSAIKVKPKFVALPESTDDVRKLMRFCYQLAGKGMKVPVTVRGAGMDTMGADLANGLVISTEKLNRLMEADKRERLVRVQAGITLKELNTALSVNGLTVPIGGRDRETIGGLISGCPRDKYYGKYGGIMNYVERIEVVLANGDVLQTNRLSGHMLAKKAREKTLEGGIYRKLDKIVHANDALLKELRKRPASLAGYPQIAQASRRSTLDLMPLFFGAEGTLGVITEIILRAVPIKKQPRRAVAVFDEFRVAKKFLEVAEGLKPRELDFYDVGVLKAAEKAGKKTSKILENVGQGYIIYAAFDDNANSCLKKLAGLRKVLPKTAQLVVESQRTTGAISELEGLMANAFRCEEGSERVPLLTDFYLPPEKLEGFVNDLKILEQSLGMPLALCGSYSAANYSLRPSFRLDAPDFSKRALTFLRTGAFIINRQGGVVASGSAEGRVKAVVTNASMPEVEKNLYLEIKAVFDRYGILNPTVKLGANARFTISHFRTTSSAKIVI